MHSESKPDEVDQEIWILNGPENILNFYITRAKLIKNDVVCCYDYAGPVRIKKTVPIWRTPLLVNDTCPQNLWKTDPYTSKVLLVGVGVIMNQ